MKPETLISEPALTLSTSISKTVSGFRYQQVYIVKKKTNSNTQHDALFQCGEWVYGGTIEVESEITFDDLKHLPALLQKQQHKLNYKCMSERYVVKAGAVTPLHCVY